MAEIHNGDQKQIESLYEESDAHVNAGGKTIHAKRIKGLFRRLKWWSASFWLIFFIGPYLRWDDRQAVLFNIPDREFMIFGVVILPQDVWMLALVLLFFALLLAAVTSLAGRVFCGYFCFQTVWTDLFTLIEEKLEGTPAQRYKLDAAPWGLRKTRIKLTKHTIWMLIGILTGISFTAWFTDAYQLWADLFAFDLPMVAWFVIALFTAGTYGFAGFMREQVCFWLCPYARFQGVMYDKETILPSYDVARGEPRTKIRKGSTSEGGDCIDCNLCVAVCPTGVDIRQGQQEGCITCGLCIDACDEVMSKVDRPKGLVRYVSLDELEGKEVLPLKKRPRVLVYFAIMIMSVLGIIYGLSTIASVELKVLHERQPLYVTLSDGSIQNKYQLKLLNKQEHEIAAMVMVQGHPDIRVVGDDKALNVKGHALKTRTILVKIPQDKLTATSMPIEFIVTTGDKVEASYKSMFIGPKQ